MNDHQEDYSLARLAYAVREAQRRYFKTRSREDLVESKRLERQLDGLLAELLGKDTAMLPGLRP